MTAEEIAQVFTDHFLTPEALGQSLAMLQALLNVEIANASAGLAQAEARAAVDTANTVVAQKSAEADSARATFAALVAAAASQG